MEAADNEKETDEIKLDGDQEDSTQSDAIAPEENAENVPNSPEVPDVNSKKDDEVETKIDKEKPVVQAEEGPSEAERMRRKKSMLWGYMSSASKLITVSFICVRRTCTCAYVSVAAYLLHYHCLCTCLCHGHDSSLSVLTCLSLISICVYVFISVCVSLSLPLVSIYVSPSSTVSFLVSVSAVRIFP